MNNTSDLIKPEILPGITKKSTRIIKFPPMIKAIKFPLSFHIALTALAGSLLCRHHSPLTSVSVFTAVLLLSCGAALLNNLWDSEYDMHFLRTRNRAIPSGIIKKKHAYICSCSCIGTGLVLLSRFTSHIPLILGLFSVICYNFIYTPIKKRSTLAILPGALCGMLPPLIGYTAVGGTLTEAPVMLLSITIGLWQIPHFFIIQLKNREDILTQDYPSLLKIIPEDQFKLLVIIWISLYCSAVLLFSSTGILTSQAGIAMTFINGLILPLFLFYELFIKKNGLYKYSFRLVNVSILSMILIIISETI